MLLFLSVFLVVFVLWCEIGIGNILFRPNSNGKINFLPHGWIPLVVAPLKHKEFWNTDLVMFNIFIVFLFFLLGAKILDTLSR